MKKEHDWRYLLLGFGATFVAGLVKVALMNCFGTSNDDDDLT